MKYRVLSCASSSFAVDRDRGDRTGRRRLVLQGTVVNSTYVTHKTLHVSLLLLTTFGPILLWSSCMRCMYAYAGYAVQTRTHHPPTIAERYVCTTAAIEQEAKNTRYITGFFGGDDAGAESCRTLRGHADRTRKNRRMCTAAFKAPTCNICGKGYTGHLGHSHRGRPRSQNKGYATAAKHIQTPHTPPAQ